MDADKLRALQAPLKDKYREAPDSAVITLHAEGNVHGSDLVCSVETGRAMIEAGLHPATGGPGTQACSGDMLLQALVACAGVTLKAVATALGIEIRDGNLRAEGDLDFKGTLGVDRGAPVGFKDIRLKFDLETDADEDQLASLMKLTERYCVVYQTLKSPPPVAVETTVTTT
ncbi:MAG: OsmC family protein [Rhodospirillaceae bacterium]